MRTNRLLWIAVVAGGVVFGAPLLGAAQEMSATAEGVTELPPLVQEEVVIRGQTMKIWPFEDLRARGFDIEEIPREENAFWTYLEAVNAFKTLPDEIDPAYRYALGTAWPTGNDAELKAYVLAEENQKAMAIVRQASQLKQFQMCYFGDPRGSIISVLLPSLTDYRHLGRMLVVDGRRLEAEGEFDRAFDNYTAAMRMSYQVGEGITLIENLVGVAIWASANEAVEELVLRNDLSAEQLESILSELLELEAYRPTTMSGVSNERLMCKLMVDEFAARPFQLPRAVQMMEGNYDAVGAPLAVDTGWDALEARIGRLILPDRTMKSHIDTFFDVMMRNAELPAYEARWKEFDDGSYFEQIPQWNIVARYFMPSVSRACELSEICRMKTLSTRVAAALRLFGKQHHGRAPARLAELEDLLPAEDLVDPFSGRMFVYERRDAAWRFYSFSENGVDDGGVAGEKPSEFDFVVQFPPETREAYQPPEAQTAPL